MKSLKLLSGISVWVFSAYAAEFLPLQTGNTWAYRNADTGEIVTVSVGSPSVIGEKLYFQLRGYVQSPVLVRVNEKNELVALNEESGSERVLTTFAANRGHWWDASDRICSQEGLTREDRGVHAGAAGPLHDVLEIEYRVKSCADAGVQLEQFAENIGMVRRVVGSIRGPETFDLAYARVGSMEINAAPNATFSVSALYNLPPGDITALLRLRTNSSLPIPLEFASGQEFEVAVLDSAGKTVWKWSDGQVFAQSLHSKVIAGEWAVPVRIPKSALPPNGSLPEKYTVQAWLTTAGPNPHYASSVPLVITPNPAP